MIAARWAALALATGLALAALGGLAGELQASAQRLLVAAIVAVLAPLCWPGCATRPGGTALRIGLWSAGAVLLATGLSMLLGPAGQGLAPLLATGAMLLPILLLTLASAAALEARLLQRMTDLTAARQAARQAAGHVSAIGLLLLGALPVWAGPVAERLSARHPDLLDALAAASPLVHLAVASGNDLLRNEWLYEHANLAALPVSYPSLPALAGAYGLLCAALGLAALLPRRGRRPSGPARSTHPNAENTP